MASRSDPNSFGFLLTDTSRLYRAEFDRRVTEAGIGVTPGEARTLVQAARAGMVRQSVLAERMGVEAMTVSGYLDRLEANSLIERLPDPSDRRAKLVALTDKANDALARIRDVGNRLRDEVALALPAGDWAILNTSLRLLRDRLDGIRCERGGSAS
ncbi:MAG: MarR family transcriptional regulator [Mesorhizobium sp.]